MSDADDSARRAMALVKAGLELDAEGYRLLRPAKESEALRRLWNLDPFGAALVEQEEVSDRELAKSLLALVIVVAESSGMGRDGLAEFLGRALSEPTGAES